MKINGKGKLKGKINEAIKWRFHVSLSYSVFKNRIQNTLRVKWKNKFAIQMSAFKE